MIEFENVGRWPRSVGAAVQYGASLLLGGASGEALGVAAAYSEALLHARQIGLEEAATQGLGAVLGGATVGLCLAIGHRLGMLGAGEDW